MKKLIKKLGGSLIITFDKEDRKLYGVKEGDVIDIEFVRLPDFKTAYDLNKEEQENENNNKCE